MNVLIEINLLAGGREREDKRRGKDGLSLYRSFCLFVGLVRFGWLTTKKTKTNPIRSANTGQNGRASPFAVANQSTGWLVS